MYTRLFAAFRKSGCNEQGGQLIEDSIESDTIFYENYVKNKCPNNARLMLYVHLLWGRAPPAFCLRTKPEHAQSQTGIPGKDINTLGSPAGVTKRELSLAAFGDQLVTAVSSLGGQKMSTEQLAKVHEEESVIRAATLSREQNVSRYFKLLSDAEERNQLAMQPKFSHLQFQSVAHVLHAAHIESLTQARYAQVLKEAGFTTPFSLTQLSPALLQEIGLTSVGANACLMALVREMRPF